MQVVTRLRPQESVTVSVSENQTLSTTGLVCQPDQRQSDTETQALSVSYSSASSLDDNSDSEEYASCGRVT